MLKPFYFHTRMSVNKIVISADIHFSVLISWVEVGYSSQLVRPSDPGSSAVAAVWHWVLSHYTLVTSLGRRALVKWGDQCSGVGRGKHGSIHYTDRLTVWTNSNHWNTNPINFHVIVTLQLLNSTCQWLSASQGMPRYQLQLRPDAVMWSQAEAGLAVAQCRG